MDPAPAADVRIVLVTAPPDAAHGLARRLVETGLAACVNVVPGLRSVYRWQGAVHDDPESLLLVKTPASGLPALLDALAEQHPYEVPEALALAPAEGLAPYVAWLRAAVAAAPAPRPGDDVTSA
jgi:periplasmic divalent cation tolerance protein